MLQHPSQLSENGWRAMREQLHQFLDEGLDPAEARARTRKSADNRDRTWSFKKGPRLQLPAGFAWTQTIMNVDETFATQYCRDIEQWARCVLADAASVTP